MRRREEKREKVRRRQEERRLESRIKEKAKKGKHTKRRAALGYTTGLTYTWTEAQGPWATHAREGDRKEPLTPGLHSTFLGTALHHTLWRK